MGMCSSTRQRLLELNRRFYQRHARRFDQSRQAPWPGWEKLLLHLRGRWRHLQCLDLGCGNGRFAVFLAKHCPELAAFRGIDSSKDLLEVAKKAYPSGTWLHGDILETPWQTGQLKTNLIVLFGVLHHLPGFETRVALLQRCAQLLPVGGLLVYSHWRLDRDCRRNEKLRVAPEEAGFDIDELEPGDQFLRWDQDAQVPRYCHFPSEEEILELVRQLDALRLVDRFSADGKSGKDNDYLVLEKVESLELTALGANSP